MATETRIDIRTYNDAMVKIRAMFDAHFAGQIPYATSLALNDVAHSARRALVADLDQSFTVRSKWTERGIRVENASKRKLEARVGSLRSYMETQAKGGPRPHKTDGTFVPVEARPTPESKTTIGKWPKSMVRKGAFFAPLPAGDAGEDTHMGIWRRKGKDRLPISLLYIVMYEGDAEIPKRWHLEETVEDVVGRLFGGAERRALHKALER